MRIAKLRAALEQRGLDAMLLLSCENRQYLTLFKSSYGAVLITQKSAHFFTDSRYIEAAKRLVTELEVSLVTRERPLHRHISEALSAERACKIGAEEKTLCHEDWLFFDKNLKAELLPAQSLLGELRAIKDPGEIDSIKAAQRIAEAAFSETLPLIKPGVTEREVAAELGYKMLRLGGEGNSFPPICVSGVKSSLPHGTPGDEKISPGDFLTMDFGCVKNGYCSDMTRTVAIGHATDEMRRVYDVVLRAQLSGISAARAGATGAEVHSAGAKIIEDAGYGAFFGHGFGHGVGLEIHEAPSASPTNTQPLPKGAVITAEPGIYLPGRFGVRIEDMLLITQSGCENLTKAPKELIVL